MASARTVDVMDVRRSLGIMKSGGDQARPYGGRSG